MPEIKLPLVLSRGCAWLDHRVRGGCEETRVYRSVEDVPLQLRQKLVESTHGMNSATILIADKRGRAELVRALQGRSTDIQCRLVELLRSRHSEEPSKARGHWSEFRSWRMWLEILFPVVLGVSLWLLIESHF
jgi:hypothetical protein